ncbi:helix-turn-helix transcriptional regulator [Sporosarcina sp. 179-K 8C2 HS]|uniref:helix-turn-helix domain-containing protein n=1 Tax=Sporosarcina sp. 179-K 8C2 HS TaxID=3142387 RepID=UPI0039A1D42F
MKKRKNINEIVNETMEEFGQVKVQTKISERLEELGMSLMGLSMLTGIRYASLNELKNGKKVTLNLQHLIAIMIALRIKSFDQLLILDFVDEDKEELFDKEVLKYREQGLPDEKREQMRMNAIRLESEKELRKSQ